MKNTIKFKAMLRIAGIIALVAIIGFSFAACEEGGGGGGSGLNGTTWTTIVTTDGVSTTYELIFSGNQYTVGFPPDEWGISYYIDRGTYSESDNTLTFTPSFGFHPGVWTGTRSGNTITSSSGSFSGWIFTRNQ